MCTSEAHGGVLGEPKATVLEKDSPTAQQVLQRDYATLVEDVHFSGLDGASKLAQLAEDLCLATLNPLKRRNIEQRLRRFVEHSNPTLQQWLALQRWLHKYVGDLPPEIFRVVDLCATGQPWDRMDPTIATSLSALRKSWAETHEVLVQATGEFSVNWTDPRYLEYADRALQVHDIMTYALTLHERRSLITRLNIFNTMKRPTRIIARDRLMRSIAMHTRAASVYDEHGRKQPVDLAPLIVWLINGHDAILEPPPGWATAGTSPTEIRDTAGHLAMLQPIPIISALLLQVREIVTTLAEGSDPAVQDEGPEGAARRSKLKLVRELSVAGTMPLFDLDAVAPSDTERRAAREEFLRNERNKTTSVYKTNLTLRGLVPIVEMDSVGDESVAVELERDLHERLSAVPRNATRTVRHFVTGGGVAESIRASNNRADEMARVDNTTWVFEQEKAAAMEQRGLPLLRDGDDDAAPRSGALGPFPVYLDHIDANVTPQAILNAFQASVGGVTYVETRRGTVHALEVAAAAEEAKLAAFALEIEASGVSGDGADGGDVGDGGEGRGHAAFGLENHFERQGTRTIMGDVDEALGPISSSEETTKWMEWKSEQLAKERAAEEERERTSTMNPFLDDDGLEESGDVEAIEALEAYLIESDHSAGSGGVDAAFTSRMVEDGDEEEEANGAVEEPLLDDTLQGKMTRKYGVIEYNARKKKLMAQAAVHSYAVVCFDSKEAQDRALADPLRYFGIAIEVSNGASASKAKKKKKEVVMHMTQSAAACSRLWIGGLPDGRHVTDVELIKALNQHTAKSCALRFSLVADGVETRYVERCSSREADGVALGDALEGGGGAAEDEDDGGSGERPHFLNRNFAYIQFDNPLVADLARRKLKGAVVQGRPLQVNWARDWSKRAFT